MINLKELLNEKQRLEKIVNGYTSKINERMYKFTGIKSMNYSDLKVQTSHTNDSAILNALEAVEELYDKRKKAMDKLDMTEDLIDDIYKKTNDRNIKIYMERNFYGFTAIQIGIRYEKSERQVQRICKEVKRRIEEQDGTKKEY